MIMHTSRYVTVTMSSARARVATSDSKPTRRVVPIAGASPPTTTVVSTERLPASTESNIGRSSASTKITRGSVLVTWCFRKPPFSSVLTGTKIAPRLCTAVMISRNALPLWHIAETRSPGPTPSSARPDASAEVSSSSCLNVNDCPSANVQNGLEPKRSACIRTMSGIVHIDLGGVCMTVPVRAVWSGMADHVPDPREMDDDFADALAGDANGDVPRRQDVQRTGDRIPARDLCTDAHAITFAQGFPVGRVHLRFRGRNRLQR